MASTNCIRTNTFINLRLLCFILFAFSLLPCLVIFYKPFHCSSATCDSISISCRPTSLGLTSAQPYHDPADLLNFSSSWNHLSFPSKLPTRTLKLALFVKKWPRRHQAGGLERHAQTLHSALAKRGHQIHIFTAASPHDVQDNMFFHGTTPTKDGCINQSLAWAQFRALNSDTDNMFDVIHSESGALYHVNARNFSNLVVSWHGIAYETIHSDIVQDMLRGPNDKRQNAITERIGQVVNEVKFFQDYAHHVAISDYVGDVLRMVYMIPEERVHVIVNGVDESVYRLDVSRGKDFRQRIGVPENATLVFGLAGRLVKDKGHPLMFQVIKQLCEESKIFKENVFFLVAGDGPWASRYRKLLGTNVVVLGPLEQSDMASFYNALDVFIDPTFRSQGLDLTLIEAMMSGVAVAATRFASITGSLIVGPQAGYTFLPTADSLKMCLYQMLEDGKVTIRNKGEFARSRAFRLFTASKMALAYERLLLCIASRNETNKGEIDYCKYQK